MSSTRTEELEAAAKEVARSFVEAWSYFNVLSGITEAAGRHPEVTERFRWLFSDIYRAVFDALFAKIGTLVDKTPGTHSIVSFAKRVKVDPDLRRIARDVERDISAVGGVQQKLRNWRHRMVAHRVESGDNQTFFEENKMHLGEIEGAITTLETLFNSLTVGALGIHHDNRSGTTSLSEEVMSLFASVELSGVSGPTAVHDA